MVAVVFVAVVEGGDEDCVAGPSSSRVGRKKEQKWVRLPESGNRETWDPLSPMSRANRQKSPKILFQFICTRGRIAGHWDRWCGHVYYSAKSTPRPGPECGWCHDASRYCALCTTAAAPPSHPLVNGVPIVQYGYRMDQQTKEIARTWLGPFDSNKTSMNEHSHRYTNSHSPIDT